MFMNKKNLTSVVNLHENFKRKSKKGFVRTNMQMTILSSFNKINNKINAKKIVHRIRPKKIR